MSEFDAIAAGADCRSCWLYVRREGGPVPPELREKAIAIAVGEGPGSREVEQGKPFVGDAGNELVKSLAAMGYRRSDLSISNGILCKYPGPASGAYARMMNDIRRENKDRKSRGLDPLPSPIDCCRPRLLRELAQHENIITLGKVGLQAVTGGDYSLFDVRGGPLEIEGPELARKRVLPTLHPAFVLRAQKWRKTLRIDLRRALRWFTGKLEWKDPVTCIQPSPEWLARFLFQFAPGGRRPRFYAWDLETDSKEPLDARIRCVGIGTPEYVCVVPLLSIDGVTRFYLERDEWRIIDLLRKFLLDPSIQKVGHNSLVYDTTVVQSRWGVTPVNHYDTLAMHRSVESELPHGLGYVGSVYTDVTAWKADKAGTEAETDRELYEYNCLMSGTPIVLGDGSTLAVETLVQQRYAGNVLTLDSGGNVVERRVVGWSRARRPDQPWVQIRTAAMPSRVRGLTVTPDHGVWTRRGFVQAEQLQPGDEIALPEATFTDYQRDAVLGTLIGDSVLVASPTLRAAGLLSAHALAVSGGHTVPSGLAAAKCEVLPFLRLGPIRPAKRVVICEVDAQQNEFQPITSPMLHQLARLAPMVYGKDNRRRLFVETLEAMGPVGWAWWFMDDGCRQNGGLREQNTGVRGGAERNPDSVAIAAQRYPREDVDAAVGWLRVKFGACWAGKDKVIRLGYKAAELFCEAVAPYIFPGVRYKLPRGHAWPDFVTPKVEPVKPAWTRVTSVSPFIPPRGDKQRELRAETRYCIEVEDTHRFFTSYGLVKNSTDVCVTARVVEPLADAVKIRQQQSVVRNDARVLEACVGMHRLGMRVDPVRRDEYDRQLLAEAVRCRKICRDAIGIASFNPGSVPQVQEILFERWNLPPIELSEITGEPSTGDDVLIEYRVNQPLAENQLWFIDGLRRYRRAVKIRGTDIVKYRRVNEPLPDDTFWEDVEETPEERKYRQKKDLKKVGILLADARVHSSWNQLTTTGRCNSSDPNLQNKQRKYRDMYVPEPDCRICGEPHVFVAADMDQLELRFSAANWKLARYLAIFEAGGDPHAETGKAVFGEAARRTLAAAESWAAESGKKAKEFPDWKRMRDFSKRFFYAVQYAAEDETVHKVIVSVEDDAGNLVYADVSRTQTAQRRAALLEANPQMVAGWDSEIETFRRQGFLREPVWGRRRDFLNGWSEDTKREIVNFGTQSGSAAIVHLSMFDLLEAIPFEKWCPKTGLVHQGHDALVLEAPKSKSKWTAGVLKECMTRRAPCFPGMLFSADSKIGENWGAV